MAGESAVFPSCAYEYPSTNLANRLFSRWRVYKNWASLDPFFALRLYLRDLGHPRSPLSSTSLVHAAFFSPEFPEDEVKTFELLLTEYESYQWPMQMMWRFVDRERVLQGVGGGYWYEDVLLRHGENMSGAKVSFEVVKGSGHHVQNDAQWEDAASIIKAWAKDLEEID